MIEADETALVMFDEKLVAGEHFGQVWRRFREPQDHGEVRQIEIVSAKQRVHRVAAFDRQGKLVVLGRQHERHVKFGEWNGFTICRGEWLIHRRDNLCRRLLGPDFR